MRALRFVVVLGLAACGKVESPDADADADTDTDADSDADTDSDSDSDTDTDTDADTDTDSETYSDTVSDTGFDHCGYDFYNHDCSDAAGVSGCPAIALCLSGSASDVDTVDCLGDGDGATCEAARALAACACANCGPDCGDLASGACHDCACASCAGVFAACFGAC